MQESKQKTPTVVDPAEASGGLSFLPMETFSHLKLT
jgi:hypothetical protein